jgi:predicted negative regulator of RcsB-dependent stress response
MEKRKQGTIILAVGILILILLILWHYWNSGAEIAVAFVYKP